MSCAADLAGAPPAWPSSPGTGLVPSYSLATCSLITLPMADLVASGTMAAVLMNRYGPSAYPRLLESGDAVHEPDESAAARVRRAAAGAGLVPRIAAGPADRLAHPWRYHGDRTPPPAPGPHPRPRRPAAGGFRRSCPGFTRCHLQRRSRRGLPALSRSPTTAVAYLPYQNPEMYQGCGSTSL